MSIIAFLVYAAVGIGFTSSLADKEDGFWAHLIAMWFWPLEFGHLLGEHAKVRQQAGRNAATVGYH